MTLTDHRNAVLERAGYRCELARMLPGHVCSGRLQSAHLLPKQSIRTEQSKARFRTARTGTTSPSEQRLIETPLEVLVCDSDNGAAFCSDGHRDHDLHRRRVPRSALPGRIFAFAEHYALDGLLDREYPTRTENR